MIDKILIEDYRQLKDYKGSTFNNIKSCEVKKELIKCLIDNNHDKSLYWMGEILSSCNFLLLWEIFFYIVSNVTNVSNIKILVFLDKKYSNFKEIINQIKNEEELLNLRNNNVIRNIFCDIIILLCVSDKQYMLDYSKMNIKNFSFDNLNTHLKAPNVNYINNFFKDKDPKELYIILNEFVFNLEENNVMECFKWIYIYMNYYTKCKKNNNILVCEVRKELNLDKLPLTLQCNPIWIIWSILIEKTKNNKRISQYIDILLNFFKVQLSLGKIRSRLNLLFFSISIYSQRNSKEIFNKPIVKNKEKFIEIDTIARNSLNNVFKKIMDNYKKNPEIFKPQKIDKTNKVSVSFEKLKLLDNFMLNKNNDTN
tara:strand:+ start:1824 stop:2927 length:1104 start_codon:yes stop_codon:yes gene_type:complete